MKISQIEAFLMFLENPLGRPLGEERASKAEAIQMLKRFIKTGKVAWKHVFENA